MAELIRLSFVVCGGGGGNVDRMRPTGVALWLQRRTADSVHQEDPGDIYENQEAAEETTRLNSKWSKQA